MSSNQNKLIHQIQDKQGNLIKTSIDYWHHYSSLNTWQFWVIVLLFIIPLVVIYLLIDRKKALLIGFYGFNVHVWFTYIDTFGGSNNYWFYPYKAIPFFTTGLALDASFVPVLFMLVYQWTLNHKKNYYFVFFLLCAFMAFVFKRFLIDIGLFQLTKANYIFLFIGYLTIAVVSKLITNVFIWFEKVAKRT